MRGHHVQVGACAVRHMQRRAGEHPVAQRCAGRVFGIGDRKACDQLARGQLGQPALLLRFRSARLDRRCGKPKAGQEGEGRGVPAGFFCKNGQLDHAEPNPAKAFGHRDAGKAQFLRERAPKGIVHAGLGHCRARALACGVFSEERLRRFGDHRLFFGEGEPHLSCPRLYGEPCDRPSACRPPRPLRTAPTSPVCRPWHPGPNRLQA